MGTAVQVALVLSVDCTQSQGRHSDVDAVVRAHSGDRPEAPVLRGSLGVGPAPALGTEQPGEQRPAEQGGADRMQPGRAPLSLQVPVEEGAVGHSCGGAPAAWSPLFHGRAAGEEEDAAGGGRRRALQQVGRAGSAGRPVGQPSTAGSSQAPCGRAVHPAHSCARSCVDFLSSSILEGGGTTPGC